MAVGEQNLSCYRVVGVKVGGIQNSVWSGINGDQHVQLAVPIEVGYCYVAILRYRVRKCDGFQKVDIVLGNICAADDVYAVNSVAANQFWKIVSHHICRERHCHRTSLVIVATPAQPLVAIGWTGAKPSECGCVIDRIADVYLRPAVVVEVGDGDSSRTGCVHIGGGQQLTVNVVGTQLVVVTEQDDRPLPAAVAVGVAHKAHRPAIARMDRLWGGDGADLLKVGPSVDADGGDVVVIAGGLPCNYLSASVPVDITH